MFAERLKLLRSRSDISQAALGQELFVSQQTVAKWERGKATPNSEMLKTIAGLLNVSVDYLIGANADESTPTQINKNPTAAMDDELEEYVVKFKALSADKRREAMNYLNYIAESQDKK